MGGNYDHSVVVACWVRHHAAVCDFTIRCCNSRKKAGRLGAEQGDDLPLLTEQNEQVLDNAQVEATALLYGVAEWIDSFFDDGRFSAEENKSRATLKLSMGYSENDNFEIKPRLDVRLKLPKLSSRAHLIIEAAGDSDFNIDDSHYLPT